VPQLETALLGAVSRGEITAAFQPQIDLQTGRIVASEALCRWRHPELGTVPPIRFITAAEDLGMIDELGYFMAEQCVAALARWEIDISVNVSPYQLETSDFTEWLAERLRVERTHGVSLTLEITESRAITDVASVLRRLAPLRDLGVGVALDDFGTGHASLTQLKRLHGTEVKLDRSLVTDPSTQATARMAEVIEVAHGADIRVVAEGIETYAELARVRELGCDRGQGYLIGRPASEDEFAGIVAA
jgi:EAL domain-containing protein (putative c-di-GMP-specific phosphodiesterase class I)